ncbi:MAG: hypothetical protein LBB16_02785 [Puniceicoccales bacterium]|jgi:hypothetical protein|nr:hypothetical protein [Puniceicoccales bacterium]
MINDNKDAQLKDAQLEKLLRLKRFEMPPKERWLEFDYAFENRRLFAIKESKIKMIFSSVGAIFNFKRIVYSAGFCLLLLIVSIVSVREKVAMNNTQLAKEFSQKYVQFARDGMLVLDDGMDIRADICNINHSKDGIEYVQDMLTMQNNPFLLARK